MSEVPRPLASVAERLLCPHCGRPLRAGRGSLVCAADHCHDVARQGYVSLLGRAVGRTAGDDAAMLAARVQIERADVLANLTAMLVGSALTFASDDPSLVLDLGAGTGKHLAALLDVCPAAVGVAIDVSRAASRRAARAHRALAAVRADAWSQIPLADSSVDIALNVFAPRNGSELARVIRPGGLLLVASAGRQHLAELRDMHEISVHPDKVRVIDRQLNRWFAQQTSIALGWPLSLDAGAVAAVLQMGPATRHLRANRRISIQSFDKLTVTAAVELRIYLRGNS